MAILDATLLSLVAGLATGLGGLLVALLGKLSMRSYDALLGFAAGVMTSIATLGLILEASTQTTSIVPLVGVAVGAAALFAFDRFLPHQHLGLERSEIRPPDERSCSSLRSHCTTSRRGWRWGRGTRISLGSGWCWR